jgi:hypothetical protein
MQIAPRRLDVSVAEKHLSQDGISSLVIEGLSGGVAEFVHGEVLEARSLEAR